MADPNTKFNMFRKVLAKIIEPRPDPGKGWCVGCSFNDGFTTVVPVEELEAHARKHVRSEVLWVEASWPEKKGS